MIDYIRHLFLPHHTNNFRARILHIDFFAFYVIVFFMMSFIFKTIHKIDPDILGFATNIHVDNLLYLTNQKRGGAGLGSLKLNSQLSQAAAGKAADMFSKNYWAHTAPDGTTPWDFINGAGYVYTVAGENLAKNFSDSAGVVEAWMNSPTHRDNILRSDYQDVGFAVVNGVLNGEETTLVIQMFGKSLAGSSVAQRPASPPPAITAPVGAAVAREESSPVAKFESELEATPSQVASIAALPRRNVVITAFADSVVKNPRFDLGKISKELLLGLTTLLMIVLVVDGIYIWHRKIVRVGGRNIAHLIFLFAISGIIWFMSFGSIL